MKGLEILDDGLNKVVTMLDSVQGDVKKFFRAVQSASVNCKLTEPAVLARRHIL